MRYAEVFVSTSHISRQVDAEIILQTALDTKSDLNKRLAFIKIIADIRQRAVIAGPPPPLSPVKGPILQNRNLGTPSQCLHAAVKRWNAMPGPVSVDVSDIVE